MKKILVILMAILCIPISGFAMSLSTLENNPQRYIKISEDYNFAVYTDAGSVKSIRYSPPYYTLSTNTYYVVYKLNMVVLYSEIYNYDYNYSTESTMKRIVSDMYDNGETPDEETVCSRTEAAQRENSGIERNGTCIGVWKLNGQPMRKSLHSSSSTKSTVTYHTVGFDIAEAVFRTYYKQYF